MQSNTPQNPYSNAASTYGDHSQKHTPDQRELEARVLLKAASMMQDLQANFNPDDLEKIDEVLKYNRQVWMIFFDTAVENKEGDRPNDLRSNIVNLANFVFKRTVEILSAPTREKFDVLITINRDIAAGLMTKPKNTNETGSAPLPSSTQGTGTTATSA